MSVFIVSYELKNETSSAAYRPLWDALEKLTSQKVQRSVWLVATTSKASAVHDHLMQYLDSDDRLWVSKINRPDYDYTKAVGGTTDFLKKHL